MFLERRKVDETVNDGANTSTAAVTEPIDKMSEDDRSCPSGLKSFSVLGASKS